MTTDARLSVFEQLDLPDTDLTRDTYAYVERISPVFVRASWIAC
ncbi:hypothetical protein ACWC9U_19240 [Streptomyces sp. 900116325]